MEIELRYIPFEASQWDVKRAIGAVLHSDEFFNASEPTARLINFDVNLNKHKAIEARNDGTGVLVLPDSNIGQKLLRVVRTGPHQIRMNKKKLFLVRSSRKLDFRTKERLEKTLYLNPEIEEELEDKLRKLDVGLHVNKVQFGVYYREAGDTINNSRLFSVEHEVAYRERSAGILEFEYTHKLIRIRLGDPRTEELAYNIVITFANIRKMATGLDFGNPFICFELHTPPIFQLERFNRTLTGTWSDERKFRMRMDSLSPGHAAVAPYAHQMRIILHEQSDIDKFSHLCFIADVGRPFRTYMEAFSNGFFAPVRVHRLERMLKEFDWHVAFQFEALLRNGLLNTEDLMGSFYGPVKQLCVRKPQVAASILRLFTENMRAKDPRESATECFEKICSREDPERFELAPGNFLCHHVTVTPTRMLLEGPFVIQSNRVIRQYKGFEDRFIRVDFRDEDRLQYRWDRDTDGTSLLQGRVGKHLKKGFTLAGRDFEFLAYSSSALREHAVWYVNPFDHPEKGRVTADSIRQSLGDFSSVIMCPSKYAARLAQAFTATDPSVDIKRDQWEVVDDLGEEPYLFTDGVGTISKELGDMIWNALCEVRDISYRVNNVQPSAYQIRFLGFKGMVVVDERLPGIAMRLRQSMDKFQGPEEEAATIEIARAFERPNTCYLNRPLVMILEDRGVNKEAFLKLQGEAVANINMSSDKILACRQLFRDHSLGTSFRLSYIWQFLAELDMGMEYERTAKYTLQDAFFERLIQYAKNDVLRSIKHNARIPLPESWLLVGVADEGAAYVAEGCEDVFTLKEGQIYACVQNSANEPPIYLEGPVVIARSPVVHPGDVQRVDAIGKPPDDGKLCFFRNLKNVVVLPCAGPRSLASMLGGGDLDGDLYSIICESTLLPTEHADAAEYPPVDKFVLDRDSTVDDICDFIIEYIDSDVLGLLSDRHLIIADQSREGTKDEKCIELARLCSQAVDYPKNGRKVDIQNSPRWLIPYKPDWKQAEDNAPRRTDYYQSDRALGELYRKVHLLDAPKSVPPPPTRPHPLSDSISLALQPHIEWALGTAQNSDRDLSAIAPIFRRYADELRYISVTHSLSDSPESRLDEEEVVVGTITAVCSQTRFRNDRSYRMRLHSKTLVDSVRKKLYQHVKDPTTPEATGVMRYGLAQAWLAWDYGMRNRHIFGANSFSIIALGSIAAALSDMGKVNMKREKRETDASGDDDN